jgi:hypothetical protein
MGDTRFDLIRRGLPLEEVAEREGVTTHAIRKHCSRNGTTVQALRPVPYLHDERGYPEWRHQHEGQEDRVRIHRLAAVAEYGVEAVAGGHVHHRDGCVWNSGRENLEVLGPAEHMNRHRDDLAQEYDDRERDGQGRFTI